MGSVWPWFKGIAGESLRFCRGFKPLPTSLTGLSDQRNVSFREGFWICCRAVDQNSCWGTSCSAIALLRAPHMPTTSFQNEHAFFFFWLRSGYFGRSKLKQGGKMLCSSWSKMICIGHLCCELLCFGFATWAGSSQATRQARDNLEFLQSIFC